MATRIMNGEQTDNSEYTKVTIVTVDNVNEYVKERDEVIASMKQKSYPRGIVGKNRL